MTAATNSCQEISHHIHAYMSMQACSINLYAHAGCLVSCICVYWTQDTQPRPLNVCCMPAPCTQKDRRTDWQTDHCGPTKLREHSAPVPGHQQIAALPTVPAHTCTHMQPAARGCTHPDTACAGGLSSPVQIPQQSAGRSTGASAWRLHGKTPLNTHQSNHESTRGHLPYFHHLDHHLLGPPKSTNTAMHIATCTAMTSSGFHDFCHHLLGQLR